MIGPNLEDQYDESYNNGVLSHCGHRHYLITVAKSSIFRLLMSRTSNRPMVVEEAPAPRI